MPDGKNICLESRKFCPRRPGGVKMVAPSVDSARPTHLTPHNPWWHPGTRAACSPEISQAAGDKPELSPWHARLIFLDDLDNTIVRVEEEREEEGVSVLAS